MEDGGLEKNVFEVIVQNLQLNAPRAMYFSWLIMLERMRQTRFQRDTHLRILIMNLLPILVVVDKANLHVLDGFVGIVL